MVSDNGVWKEWVSVVVKKIAEELTERASVSSCVDFVMLRGCTFFVGERC